MPALPGTDKESGIRCEICASNFCAACRGASRQVGGLQRAVADLGLEGRNLRVHGTTHMEVRRGGTPISSRAADCRRPSYPFLDQELRQVGRDAFVNWHGSGYSVRGCMPQAGVGAREECGMGKCITVTAGSPGLRRRLACT